MNHLISLDQSNSKSPNQSFQRLDEQSKSSSHFSWQKLFLLTTKLGIVKHIVNSKVYNFIFN